MYDIFFIGKKSAYSESLRNKYLFIKVAPTVEAAQRLSLTSMFWIVWDDIIVEDSFHFDLKVPVWDQQYIHVFLNGDHYDGIALIPKRAELGIKEIKYRFFANKKEIAVKASQPRLFDTFQIETYEQYLEAMENSTTDMFWMTNPNLKIADDFKFDLYITHHNAYDRAENHAFVHLVNGEQLYNGIFLLSKHKPVSRKEIEHRHIIERKEWTTIASGPCQYDIFEIESYEQYEQALASSKTEMFWMTTPNLTINDAFKFDLYLSHDQYDRCQNHAFVHLVNDEKFYNGVFLLSKHKPVSRKEIEHRYIIERKDWDVVASGPCQYDIFEIETYQQYLNALTSSKTEMFWMTTPNLKIADNFKFDPYLSHDQYDRCQNHAFTHLVNNEKFYNGVFLLSKHKPLTVREIEHRHIIERKEWDIVASGPCQYDIFEIEAYEEYLYAMQHSKTEMFWMTSPNIQICDDFKFDLYLSHDQYDRTENHAFIHLVEGEKFYNGVFLLSKHKPVSEKEINFRFLINKKDWDIVASEPCHYDRFYVNTYQQYLDAMQNSKTEMFWVIPSEVEPLETFKFDIYFQHYNTYDRKINHSFKHLFRGEETYNGIFLMSKHVPVSEKEITFRYLVERKEWDIVASKMQAYDIVFISYNEINADQNFDQLKSLYPRVKRVHGVKGIHQAHIRAAEIANTENFWVVDGDAKIVDDFKFDFEIPVWDRNTVHVWQSQNPINDLVYGYGGVKLLPRQLTLNMDVTRPDMTTSISKDFKAMLEVSNITAFNTDEFSTWKSAFRECAKLAGKAIDRQVDNETEQRLNVWCTQGADKPYGEFAVKGALAGRKFATEHPEDLFKINNFDWLYDQFISEKNRDQ